LLLLLAVLYLLGDLPHLLLADVVPDAVHGGVTAQLAQVAAREARRLLRDLLQVDGVAQLEGKQGGEGRGHFSYFKITFRAFGRRVCPKQITINTFNPWWVRECGLGRRGEGGGKGGKLCRVQVNSEQSL